MPQPALLLLAHGTRDPRGLAEVKQLARGIEQHLPGWTVELGFLELARPTVDEALHKLLDSVPAEVIVEPLLLFAAGHWKRDVPKLLAPWQARHPQLRWHTVEPLDCDPGVVELAVRRYWAAVGCLGMEGASLPLAPTDHPLSAAEPGWGLVMVGRGTSDPLAQQRLHRLAQLVARRVHAPWVQACFVVGGKPLLEEVLGALARQPRVPLVVQPHLLFHGQVLEEIRHRVQGVARRLGSQWIRLAEHLGPDAQLAQLLAQKALAAIQPLGPDPQPDTSCPT